MIGKVAFVSGGSRGIGAAIARRFAAAGCHIAIGYRGESPASRATLRAIADAGAKGLGVAGDIARPGDACAMVSRVVEQFGHIDIVVNCAGVSEYRAFEESDAELFHTIFDANVLGAILVIQAALPHLTAPGGRIINFSSALATRPVPTTAFYSASKAAITTLSHALAKEFGPRGITVNAIAPGVIETEMTADILVARGANIVAMTALARIGQPDDIAGIAYFLASPDAGWITGRTILADGGLS